jgi:hypothetical protein
MGVNQIDALIAELSDWRDRALAAEARAADLERKLRGWQKRHDPIERLRSDISKPRRRYTD